MSRHRAEPPRHRSQRPQGGRSRLLALAGLVSGAVLVVGIVVLPSQADKGAVDVARDPNLAGSTPSSDAALDTVVDGGVRASTSSGTTAAKQRTAKTKARVKGKPSTPPAIPEDSGDGRRVVFSEAEQRVWLVADGERVERTYLVSGSIYDNLDPGTYAVYSRSEQAYAFDGSGSMKYFVRFTQGDTAAIGFHQIPVDNTGVPVQTLEELGTPLSHGCVRQAAQDAEALWDFAPIGTTVVVV